MKTPPFILAAGFVLVFAAGCASTAAQTAPETAGLSIAAPEAPLDPAPPPELIAMTADGSITLFEGGCFFGSPCETVEITLYPTGVFTVAGNNEHAGSSGNIGPDTFAATEAFLLENGFATMPEWMDGSGRSPWTHERAPYPCMNHAPAFTITRRPGDGSERRIYWDVGCPSAPMADFRLRFRAAMKVDEILSYP